MNSVASQSSSSGCVGVGALSAEVVLGLDQAAAEVLLPDAVDGDAGRQRISRIDQPRARSSRVAPAGNCGESTAGNAG